MINDRIAISELLIRYGTSIDAGNYQEFVEVFSEDAVIYHGSGKVYRGRDEIWEHARDFDRRRVLLPNMRHFHTDMVIRIDGDQATSKSHVLVTICDKSGIRLEYAGEYQDKLKKENDRWEISERRYVNDAPLRIYEQ